MTQKERIEDTLETLKKLLQESLEKNKTENEEDITDDKKPE